MSRRNFVLSWGRKMFFGFSWPLSIILGMVYFQSYIFPSSTLSWFYWFLTIVGLYGFVHSCLYFLVYVPIVVMLPTYYVCRLIALILILMLNVCVLLDGILFAQLRIHIGPHLLQTLVTRGPSVLFGSSSTLYFILLGMLIVSGLFWFRADQVWKSMQKRFSNPVKNWYIVGSFSAFLLSLAILFNAKDESRAIARTSMLFPLGIPQVLKQKIQKTPPEDFLTLTQNQKEFFYPSQDIKCSGKSNRNILLFIIEGWSAVEEQTPVLNHLSMHAMNFRHHLSVGLDRKLSLFNLMYGLPGSYFNAARKSKTPPAFFTELKKRGYSSTVFFNSLPEEEVESLLKPEGARTMIPQTETSTIPELWKTWLNEPPKSPFFSIVYLRNTGLPRMDWRKQVDQEINLMLSLAYGKGALRDAQLIFTTDTPVDAGPNETSLISPLLIITPQRNKGTFDHLTSHYDVLATTMRELWECKNDVSNFSSGKLLTDPPTGKGLVVSSHGKHYVLDIKNHRFSELTLEGSVASEEEVVLNSLKELSRFFKKK